MRSSNRINKPRQQKLPLEQTVQIWATIPKEERKNCLLFVAQMLKQAVQNEQYSEQYHDRKD